MKSTNNSEKFESQMLIRYFECPASSRRANSENKILALNDKTCLETAGEFGDREPYMNFNETVDLKLTNPTKSPSIQKHYAKNSKNRKCRRKNDNKQPKIKKALAKVSNYEDKLMEAYTEQSLIDGFNPEDTQVALALSLSTNDYNIRSLPNTQVRMHTLKQTLEQFGFKNSKPRVVNSNRVNIALNNIKSALLQRNTELQNQIMEHNIVHILNEQKCTHHKSDKYAKFRIYSDIILCHVSKINDLYKVSADGLLSYNGLSLVNIDDSVFDSLLKDWDSIPGRSGHVCDANSKWVNEDTGANMVISNKTDKQLHEMLKYQEQHLKNCIVKMKKDSKSVILNTASSVFQPLNNLNNNLQVSYRIEYCKSPDLFSDCEESYHRDNKSFYEENEKDNMDSIKFCKEDEFESAISENSLHIRANRNVTEYETYHETMPSNFCLNRFFNDLNSLSKHDTSTGNNTLIESFDIFDYNSLQSIESNNSVPNNSHVIKQINDDLKSNNFKDEMNESLSISHLERNFLKYADDSNKESSNNLKKLSVVINSQEKLICDEIALFPKCKNISGCHNTFKKNSFRHKLESEFLSLIATNNKFDYNNKDLNVYMISSLGHRDCSQSLNESSLILEKNVHNNELHTKERKKSNIFTDDGENIIQNSHFFSNELSNKKKCSEDFQSNNNCSSNIESLLQDGTMLLSDGEIKYSTSTPFKKYSLRSGAKFNSSKLNLQGRNLLNSSCCFSNQKELDIMQSESEDNLPVHKNELYEAKPRLKRFSKFKEASLTSNCFKSPYNSNKDIICYHTQKVILDDILTVEKSYEVGKGAVNLKPDFEKLSNKDCESMLKTYGIKRLKRKRTNQILEYIYDQTHPIAKLSLKK